MWFSSLSLSVLGLLMWCIEHNSPWDQILHYVFSFLLLFKVNGIKGEFLVDFEGETRAAVSQDQKRLAKACYEPCKAKNSLSTYEKFDMKPKDWSFLNNSGKLDHI